MEENIQVYPGDNGLRILVNRAPNGIGIGHSLVVGPNGELIQMRRFEESGSGEETPDHEVMPIVPDSVSKYFKDYRQYLDQPIQQEQKGGEISQSQDMMSQIIDSYKKDKKGTIAALLQQGEQGIEIVKQLAEADPEAAEIIQELQSEVEIARCGKKLTKKAACGIKVKKTKKCAEGGVLDLSGYDFSKIDFAKCGKKLKKKEIGGEVVEEKCGGKAKKVKKGETGVPVTKTWSNQSSSFSIRKGASGCPCQYKKVGGIIILTDCEGNPIKKG